MRPPPALTRLFPPLARIPGAAGLAQAVARNVAGRHHVGAIAVVAVSVAEAEPMILLARHTFHGDRWGVPGGWVRRREDPAAACVREVHEETGVEVRAVEVLGCELHAVDGIPVRYGGLTIAYRCEPLTRPDRVVLPRSIEITDVRWVDAEDAKSLVTGFERSMIAKAVRQLGAN